MKMDNEMKSELRNYVRTLMTTNKGIQTAELLEKVKEDGRFSKFKIPYWMMVAMRNQIKDQKLPGIKRVPSVSAPTGELYSLGNLVKKLREIAAYAENVIAAKQELESAFLDIGDEERV